MYTITKKEEQGSRIIEISNPEQTSKARICPNQGGRLSGLMFNDTELLANFSPSTYKDNYASAILFPFVNRIRDGKFTFDAIDYVLDCNEVDKNNALHGLVYNKNFAYVDSDLTSTYGSVSLVYKYGGTCKGFPFKFDILLTYKLSNSNLSLSIEVRNIGNKAFPFTLGWHPYFLSRDLNESTLSFKSTTKFLCDRQQIISGEVPFEVNMPYQLKDALLDDGYELQADTILFSTPEYRLNMSSTCKQNYLQLYTPNTPNVIAIEPMTGAADSFNNNIGLQILHPKAKHNMMWTIAFENFKSQIKTNQQINTLCNS